VLVVPVMGVTMGQLTGRCLPHHAHIHLKVQVSSLPCGLSSPALEVQHHGQKIGWQGGGDQDARAGERVSER